jgi:hypothetical protein
MAKNLNRFQPTLFEYPIQNNRTGWHPIWTPTILVVPWSFDINGNRIPNSQVETVTFFIEKTIEIDVAGHSQIYPGLGPKPEASPDKILFTVEISRDELNQYRISPLLFIDKDTGEPTDTPEEGDFIQYTNTRDILGQVEYLPDAEYFDLSAVEINVDNLPHGRYITSWSISYYRRISADGTLFCIDTSELVRDKLDYHIVHPGEIHDQMVNITPDVYFEGLDKKEDFTVNLYRPFADILQDVFDESKLFYGINWVNRVPSELLPYLSYLIGIDLPTQSSNNTVEKIRRNMLARGAELQRLKGSELAIKELFAILGFTIEIINLWADNQLDEGDGFIAPNDISGKVISYPVSQTDPLIANYQESGFGQINIPLTYHNNYNNIVLNAFIVEKDSQSHTDLETIINGLLIDQNSLVNEALINASDGYLMLPSEILDINQSGIQATTRLVMSDIELLSETSTNIPVIQFDGVQYEVFRDRLNITFAGYKDLSNSVMYIFATYERTKIEVADELKNNVTNRFDVEIISKVGEIESGIYDYLIDSLNTFKAFHSLLRKIKYYIDFSDYYNVTDFCSNGHLSGKECNNNFQTPPACPPDECFVSSECNEQNARCGIREDDYELRNTILNGLEEEYDRWHDVTNKWLDISKEESTKLEWAKSYSNLSIPIPNNEGDNYGQDRVSFDLIITSDVELINGQVLDMIYNGTYLESMEKTSTETFIFNIITLKYQILSDIIGQAVKINIIRRISDDQYYISMDLDIDHEVDIRSKIMDLDPLATPDYCYKGRARDFLDLDNIIPLTEFIRNTPCNLMMGNGIYYQLNNNQFDNISGWYERLLQTSDQSLHYSNDLFFEDLYKGSAIRHSLEIEKANNYFSGHRGISSGLLFKFIHPDYNTRPWDIEDTCGLIINPLNAKLISSSEGQDLVFDQKDLTYEPTNTIPDIEYYDGASNIIMTHAIFTTAPESPYVSLDNTTHTTDTEVDTEVPIFETAFQCETSNLYQDYIDGYPSSVGLIEFNIEDFWVQKEIDGQVIIESDLVPGIVEYPASYSSEVLASTSEPIGTGTSTFINDKNYKGYRYDCECQAYICDQDRACNTFFENNGKYDFSADKLEIDFAISHSEIIDADSYQYDGQIKEWWNWPSSELQYVDEYGVQYHIEFEEDEQTLDIQYETFEPRVWGEEPDGFVEDGKVFRKGILTNTRQIYTFINNDYILSAEGIIQEVTYKQTNFDCDRPRSENKFDKFSRYEIQDETLMVIPYGPHWVDVNESGDTTSVWSEVNSSSTGTYDVPFGFVDVWSTYETTKIYAPCIGVLDQTIWYEPGSSWFIGYGIGNIKWYKTSYNGIDPSQLPFQTWVRDEYADDNDPLPIIEYDEVQDILTISNNTRFDGTFGIKGSFNGASYFNRIYIFSYLVDNEGNYLIDNEGNYLCYYN